VVETTSLGGSGVAELKLSLAGQSFADAIPLGEADSENGIAGIGWLDDTTLNLCPLWRTLPRDVGLVGEDGMRRRYRIVGRCTAEMIGQSGLEDHVGGFDFDEVHPEDRAR
jgi:hypothetical protein